MHFLKCMGCSELHNPRISITTYCTVCVCVCVCVCVWEGDRKERKTCFSAFTAEPLLAVPLPHVDVSAARLRESLPTDPTVMRLLTWGESTDAKHTHIKQDASLQKKTMTTKKKTHEDILYPITNETNAQVCSCKLNSPECTSMCFRRLEYSAKDRPQPSASHRKGFSPGSGHPPHTHTHKRTHAYGWTSQHKRLESSETRYWAWFERPETLWKWRLQLIFCCRFGAAPSSHFDGISSN